MSLYRFQLLLGRCTKSGCGPRTDRARMRIQLGQYDLNRTLQLRIMTFDHEPWRHFDLDVRFDALILDFPFTRRTVNRQARRCELAAVDQSRVIVDADQPAPGPLAHD